MFVYQCIIIIFLFLTLQLAKDIISDLREILKQVRSTENKLRNEQEELENTIERALGKRYILKKDLIYILIGSKLFIKGNFLGTFVLDMSSANLEIDEI